MGRCKPLGSLNPSLSYALQLSGIKSCFLVHLKGWQMAVSCLPPVFQSLPLGWQHLLDWRSGSSHSQYEAKNRWWMQYISFTEMAELSVLSIQFHCEPKVAVKHNVYIQKYPWKLRAQIFIYLHNFKKIFIYLFFISWRLITLQYCSGFCHTLTWISHGFTCIPHPYPPSHLPLHPIPLGLPSAPGPSTCLMRPAWAGDLFHPR